MFGFVVVSYYSHRKITKHYPFEKSLQTLSRLQPRDGCLHHRVQKVILKKHRNHTTVSAEEDNGGSSWAQVCHNISALDYNSQHMCELNQSEAGRAEH